MESTDIDVHSVHMCVNELSENMAENRVASIINKFKQSESENADPSSFVTVIEVNGQKSTEASTPPPVRKPPK